MASHILALVSAQGVLIIYVNEFEGGKILTKSGVKSHDPNFSQMYEYFMMQYNLCICI